MQAVMFSNYVASFSELNRKVQRIRVSKVENERSKVEVAITILHHNMTEYFVHIWNWLETC